MIGEKPKARILPHNDGNASLDEEGVQPITMTPFVSDYMHRYGFVCVAFISCAFFVDQLDPPCFDYPAATA